VLDPSAFAEDGGPSIAERINRVLTSDPKVQHATFRPADNKRVSRGTHVGAGQISGWDQMRGRLHGDADGRPMLVTFNTCTDSIRTIPVLQHDPDKPEDLDTEAEDHAADEWRYACMSRPYLIEKAIAKPKLLEDYKKRHEPPNTYDYVTM
jgi:hypothetical protein